MVMVLMALVVFVAVFVVGYPLVNPERYQFEMTTSDDERLENLQSARDSAIDAIRDLEFDHQTGKLSDEDYRQMRARYDQRAVEVLQKMDALTAPRSKARSENGKATAPRATPQSTCVKCHARVQTGDRFCPKCGQRLA